MQLVINISPKGGGFPFRGHPERLAKAVGFFCLDVGHF